MNKNIVYNLSLMAKPKELKAMQNPLHFVVLELQQENEITPSHHWQI